MIKKGFIYAGLALACGLKVFMTLKPSSEDNSDKVRERAFNGIIKVGVGSWPGFLPLCGESIAHRLRTSGYLIKCVDVWKDGGDGLEGLKNGEISFLALPLVEWIRDGHTLAYPGSIVMVLDEVRGGMGIVARGEKYSSLESVKSSKKVSVTWRKGTQSESFLKIMGRVFDVDGFIVDKNEHAVGSYDSWEAMRKLASKEVDIAVLEEPYLSKVLKDASFHKILDTSASRGIATDVLVVNQQLASEHPEVVSVLMSHYFHALEEYNEHPIHLVRELESFFGYSTGEAVLVKDGLHWTTLKENKEIWLQGGLLRNSVLIVLDAMKMGQMRDAKDAADYRDIQVDPTFVNGLMQDADQALTKPESPKEYASQSS